MKRLWNRADYPVWSLSSYDPAGQQHNMNICTYAMPACLEPKEYMIAVYHNTHTHELLQKHPYMLMQLLSPEHHDVVRRFGFQSGKTKSKFNRLKHTVSYTDENFAYMEDVRGIWYGEVLDWMSAADHDIARVRILWSKNLHSGDPLLISELKDRGIIR